VNLLWLGVACLCLCLCLCLGGALGVVLPVFRFLCSVGAGRLRGAAAVARHLPAPIARPAAALATAAWQGPAPTRVLRDGAFRHIPVPPNPASPPPLGGLHGAARRRATAA